MFLAEETNLMLRCPFSTVWFWHLHVLSNQLLILFLLIILFQILFVFNTLLCFFSLARVILVICNYTTVFHFWWRSWIRFSERVSIYFCVLLNMLTFTSPYFDRSFVPFLKNVYYNLAVIWDLLCLIILFSEKYAHILKR